jgi:hypothetical protein
MGASTHSGGVAAPSGVFAGSWVYQTMTRHGLNLFALAQSNPCVSAETEGGVPTDEQIIRVLKSSKYAVLTVSEIAEAVGVSRQAANYHLRNMREQGRVEHRKANKINLYWLDYRVQ